jgi:hypothetical protein
MNSNVKAFFEKYDSDPALRARVQEAEDLYPGSLEIREALVGAVLLPIAEEMGLGFTIEQLRDYEEELWNARHRDVELTEEELSKDEGGDKFWLLGRGWTSDEARFCGSK